MKRSTILLVVTILSLALSGCAGLSPLRRSAVGGAPTTDMAFPMEESLEMEAPAAGMAEPDFAAQPSTNAIVASTQERLVIRNANLSVVVEDPAASVEAISALAESMGGFVVSSNVFETSFGDSSLGEPIRAKQANITIRIPSDRLDEALKTIKDDAVEVQNQNVSGQDVTEEYTDLQSRLRNLEAAEQQLLDIMEDSTDTEATLAVLQELRQVRGEIEVLQGRIQYLEQSSRLSSVSVDLIPDVATQPLQIGRWTPEGTAREAVEALINALRFLADTAIWGVICVVPVAVLLGVPLWFAGRAIWRRRQRRKLEAEQKNSGNGEKSA